MAPGNYFSNTPTKSKTTPKVTASAAAAPIAPKTKPILNHDLSSEEEVERLLAELRLEEEAKAATEAEEQRLAEEAAEAEEAAKAAAAAAKAEEERLARQREAEAEMRREAEALEAKLAAEQASLEVETVSTELLDEDEAFQNEEVSYVVEDAPEHLEFTEVEQEAKKNFRATGKGGIFSFFDVDVPEEDVDRNAPDPISFEEPEPEPAYEEPAYEEPTYEEPYEETYTGAKQPWYANVLPVYGDSAGVLLRKGLIIISVMVILVCAVVLLVTGGGSSTTALISDHTLLSTAVAQLSESMNPIL